MGAGRSELGGTRWRLGAKLRLGARGRVVLNIDNRVCWTGRASRGLETDGEGVDAKRRRGYGQGSVFGPMEWQCEHHCCDERRPAGCVVQRGWRALDGRLTVRAAQGPGGDKSPLRRPLCLSVCPSPLAPSHTLICKTVDQYQSLKGGASASLHRRALRPYTPQWARASSWSRTKHGELLVRFGELIIGPASIRRRTLLMM